MMKARYFNYYIIFWTIFLSPIPQIFGQEKEQNRLINSVNNILNTIYKNDTQSMIDPITQQGLSDSMLYGTLANIKKPVPPFVYGKYVIFVYYSEQSVARSFIAFEHEHYRIRHRFVPLESNPKVGVYFLPRTHENQQINYRLLANGIWTIDQYNPNRVVDVRGIQVSSIYAPKISPLFLPSIVKINETTIRFYLYLEGSNLWELKNTRNNIINIDQNRQMFSHVFLVGSFNNWDPYSIPLNADAETDGLFWADIPISLGTHHYYYQSGYTSFLDPHNPSRAKRHVSGDFVNTYTVVEATEQTSGAKTYVVSTTGAP